MGKLKKKQSQPSLPTNVIVQPSTPSNTINSIPILLTKVQPSSSVIKLDDDLFNSLPDEGNNELNTSGTTLNRVNRSRNTSIRSNSSSIDSNSKHSPLPSPTILSSSPESIRSSLGHSSGPSSALLQLRDQLKLDEELKQQKTSRDQRTRVDSSSSSSINSLIEAKVTTGARKLKKVRPIGHLEIDESVISADTLVNAKEGGEAAFDSTGNGCGDIGEIPDEEDTAQKVEQDTTIIHLPQQCASSSVEPLVQSILLAPPRLTYYLASSTLSTYISTTKSIISLPLTVLKKLPLTNSSISDSTHANKLILAKSRSYKLPQLNEIAYSAIESGAIVGFASVLTILAGSNLVWKKFRRTA